MNIDIGQLEFIDLKLRKILRHLEIETGYEFTITSLYRIGDKGVHGTLPLRGADLRMRNQQIGEAIAKLINDTRITLAWSAASCTELVPIFICTFKFIPTLFPDKG